jgi:hypothetical protein
MHAWYLAIPFASSPLARASEGCGLSRALWQIRAIWCPLEPPPPSITFHLLIGYAQARHAPALPLPPSRGCGPPCADPFLVLSSGPYLPTEGPPAAVRRDAASRGIPREWWGRPSAVRVASQNAFRVPNGAHFKVVAEQQARALAAQDELQMRLIRVNRPHGESAADEFVDPARRGPTASRLRQSDPVQSLPRHRLPASGRKGHRGTLCSHLRRSSRRRAKAAFSPCACAATWRRRHRRGSAPGREGRPLVSLRRATGSTRAVASCGAQVPAVAGA